ncbi:MAG: hypothetical protein ACU0DW_09090 [Shimia sp.]
MARFLFLCGLLFAAPAASAQVAALCGDETIRTSCPATCAPACGDRAFLSTNVDYCVDNGFLVPDLSVLGLRDDPQCVGFLGEDAAEAEDPCADLTSLSERRRCALRADAPSCAGSVRELEDQANILIAAIQGELDLYGDLLTTDWEDVDNRGDLCAFSLETLDRNYEIATENPAKLRASQGEAQGIQACTAEWEEYVRTESGTAGSDVLRDRLTRDAEARLMPLREQIGGLNTSIQTLEDAAGTIVQMVDLHLIYCDPEGEAQPAPTDG